MRFLRLPVGAVLALAVAACDPAPTAVETEEELVTPTLESEAALFGGLGGLDQSAFGAAIYTLEGLDLDGDGVDDPIDQRLVFSALKFNNGAIKGRMKYRQAFLEFDIRLEGRVTCMEIYDGNRVKFGGVITRSNDPDVEPGLFMWFHSLDNGFSPFVPTDQTTGAGLGDNQANEDFCNSPALPNPRFLSVITRGDIRVND